MNVIYGAAIYRFKEYVANLRRELVEAKLDYADLLLGAAAARVELTASAGGFR